MLLRAYGKAQSGKPGQLVGVPGKVRRDAKVAVEIESALAFPSVQVAAAQAAEIPQAAAAEAVIGVKQGISPKHSALGGGLVDF